MKRIVCGVDAQGASTVLLDGPPSVRLRSENRPTFPVGYEQDELWLAPAPSYAAADASEADYAVALPVGGTRFRRLVFAPMTEPAVMHQTATLDYITVVSGSISLILGDASEIELEAGDVVVQLDSLHQWWNRTSADCVMTFAQVGVDNGPA